MQYFKKFYSNKGDEIPVCFNTTSSCPRCHSAIEPVLLWGYVNDIKKGLFSVFLQCNACNNTFISSYEFTGIIEEGYTKYRTSSLTRSEPISIEKKSFSDDINELSPDFVRVYNQAFAAEQNELNDICGMGYRKAVEFLVKDYSNKISPEDKDTIKSKPLSDCINTYFDNKKLKSLALASAWLGNDQTHYEQRISDAGIKEMKAFIMALVNFIDSDLQADNAAKLINSKKSA
jgi:hypothetical protein|nr:MAG TPA: TFIIB Transcription factor zinc-finger [Caudoviricetes sp.]